MVTSSKPTNGEQVNNKDLMELSLFVTWAGINLTSVFQTSDFKANH